MMGRCSTNLEGLLSDDDRTPLGWDASTARQLQKKAGPPRICLDECHTEKSTRRGHRAGALPDDQYQARPRWWLNRGEAHARFFAQRHGFFRLVRRDCGITASGKRAERTYRALDAHQFQPTRRFFVGRLANDIGGRLILPKDRVVAAKAHARGLPGTAIWIRNRVFWDLRHRQTHGE